MCIICVYCIKVIVLWDVAIYVMDACFIAASALCGFFLLWLLVLKCRDKILSCHQCKFCVIIAIDE